jgi:protein gp37
VSGASKIEWTETTWNPTTGCDHVSPGCDNCYAERMAKRLAGRAGYPADEPFRLTLQHDRLTQPLRWRKPRLVFVNSMSDLYHRDVPLWFIGEVYAVMEQASQHTFQILTKRPQRAAGIHPGLLFEEPDGEWRPLSNVWLGTSIESDRYVYRADFLRDTPAAVRFLSCEPLLEPLPSLDLTGIDWVIAGAESGPGARPMDEDWVRDLRDRCNAAGVAFFYKQNADSRGHKLPLPLLDGRTWDEMPERAA